MCLKFTPLIHFLQEKLLQVRALCSNGKSRLKINNTFDRNLFVFIQIKAAKTEQIQVEQ